ncbi:MAG TPA: putative PEP-binding protein, partial [Candidatus Binatia bacterium]|nr:putative PEP-binding protein [Candidatus Binatia bacterium]
ASSPAAESSENVTKIHDMVFKVSAQRDLPLGDEKFNRLGLTLLDASRRVPVDGEIFMYSRALPNHGPQAIRGADLRPLQGRGLLRPMIRLFLTYFPEITCAHPDILNLVLLGVLLKDFSFIPPEGATARFARQDQTFFAEQDISRWLRAKADRSLASQFRVETVGSLDDFLREHPSSRPVYVGYELHRVSSSPVEDRRAQGTGRNRVTTPAMGQAVIVRAVNELLDVWSCFGNVADSRAQMKIRGDLAVWEELSGRDENQGLRRAIDKVRAAVARDLGGKYFNSLYWLHKLAERQEISKEEETQLLAIYENRFVISEEDAGRELQDLQDAVAWILSQKEGESPVIVLERGAVQNFADMVAKKLQQTGSKFTAAYTLYKQIQRLKKVIPKEAFEGKPIEDRVIRGQMEIYLVAVEMMSVLRHRRYLGGHGLLPFEREEMQIDELRRLDAATVNVGRQVPPPPDLTEIYRQIRALIVRENIQAGYAIWRVINRLGQQAPVGLKRFLSDVIMHIDAEFVSDTRAMGETEPVIAVVLGDITASQLSHVMQRYTVAGIATNVGSVVSHMSEELNNRRLPGIFGVPTAFLENIQEGERLALVPRWTQGTTTLENVVLRKPTLEEVGLISGETRDAEALKRFFVKTRPAFSVVFPNGSAVHVGLSADNVEEIKNSGVMDVACGIGLCRTEKSELLQAQTLPPLEDFVEEYTELAKAAKGKVVLARTADRQKDVKKFNLFGDLPDTDAYLGFNFYDTPEGRALVLRQLQAILAVHAIYPNFNVSFPMVSAPEDAAYILQLLCEAQPTGDCAGLEVSMLIENTRGVGNAAEILQVIQQQAEPLNIRARLNIGSNDLTMSALDLESRDDPTTAEKLKGVSPEVAACVIQVAGVAARMDAPLCICGSYASDEAMWVLVAQTASVISNLELSLAVSGGEASRAAYILNKLAARAATGFFSD